MESRKSRNPAAENKEIGEVHSDKVFKKKNFQLNHTKLISLKILIKDSNLK